MKQIPWHKILPYLKNKYIITLMLFFVWMMFFARHDLISQIQLGQQLNDLEVEKTFYQEKIEEIKAIDEELFTDEESLERFAREKYLMKKEDEEIFLIVEEEE